MASGVKINFKSMKALYTRKSKSSLIYGLSHGIIGESSFRLQWSGQPTNCGAINFSVAAKSYVNYGVDSIHWYIYA